MKFLRNLPNDLQRVFIFGNIYLLFYLIVAIIFSAERISLDGAYYFFHVVQHETFHVEHQRFILAVSQLLSVAGAKLHLPLKAVLLLNSVNPVLYLWLLFLLSVLWLRHAGIAWVLLLSSVCGIYFIWFIPMYEVWYGCVLLIFFAGVLERKLYKTIPQKIFFSLLLITLLFSYPLIFIGVLYFTIAHFVKERRISFSVAAIYLASFAGWFLWKYFFLSDYESGKIEYPATQVGNTLRQNFTSLSDFKNMIIFFFGVYPEEMIAWIVMLIVLLRRKDRIQVVLLSMSVTILVLLIAFTQQQPWRHSNYFERMYLLLIPLCFASFVLFVFPSLKNRIWIEAVFALILILRLTSIIHHGKDYSYHVAEIKSVIKKAEGQQGSKWMIDFTAHPELSSLDEWSLPMETLIFSSLENHDRPVTISWKADLSDPAIASKLNDSTFRLRLGEIFPDDWLNQNYFHLEHGTYHELKW